MRALIFADRIGVELQPLTEKKAVALLPIAGKELLIYTIEDLVGAGIRELVMVSSPQGEQASVSDLGEGQRWGATIRHVLSAGEEAPSALWGRLNLDDADAVLALRGDLLRSPAAQAFLDQAGGAAEAAAFCRVGADPRGGLVLLRRGAAEPGSLLDSLNWREPAPLPAEGGVTVEGAGLNCLENLPAFHRANLDLVAGRLQGLKVAGRGVALGLTAGRKARVLPKSLKQGVAYVGDHSRVDPQAELLGEVVIGADVVVDRAATIRDSVILPHTYVGELVDVGNAIVAGNHFIRVDTGVWLKISEAFLLGGLGAETGRPRVSMVDRLLGGLLLLLSLPLWPVALLAALPGGGPLMHRRELVGNRSLQPAAHDPLTFVATQWNTAAPVLRHLPGLLAVVRGDLRLVGVSALTPEESAARTEDWELVRDQAPVGLLGPTQFNLPADAPLEERLLSDAFFVREQGPMTGVRFLFQGLKALFGPEGWRPGPE